MLEEDSAAQVPRQTGLPTKREHSPPTEDPEPVAMRKYSRGSWDYAVLLQALNTVPWWA